MERYVDDILKSGLSQDELWKAILDMKKALEANGFSTKQIFSSKMWHKKFDKSFNQEEYVIDKPEIICQHGWNWYSDTLSIVPEINLYRKRRGAPGGPNLITMNVADIGCSKRIASRVVGQLFDPSGVFLSILTGSFKIFYSRICQNTEGWDDLPGDQELVDHFKEFLITVM